MVIDIDFVFLLNKSSTSLVISMDGSLNKNTFSFKKTTLISLFFETSLMT